MLASPSLEDLYHKSCALAEDPVEVKEGFQHPARLIKVYINRHIHWFELHIIKNLLFEKSNKVSRREPEM